MNIRVKGRRRRCRICGMNIRVKGRKRKARRLGRQKARRLTDVPMEPLRPTGVKKFCCKLVSLPASQLHPGCIMLRWRRHNRLGREGVC
jgi:hypothetical protein